MMKIFLPVVFVALVAAGCNSSAPSSSSTASTASVEGSQYTMSDVQKANSASKCWTAIGGSVYDLTSFIRQHPGGSQAILSLCGTDGTAEFNRQHGGQARPEQELASLKIGTLQ